ncbi:hypothetical protein SI65_09059 [Aspergillus cristatus]|uniref:RNA 3'-terminal phosphate cyclase domain-containing protein n=1 Tax=Aspergillus cristatus TaxID=573508 RepID=A0A1E3B4V3_ASPCR|nr:hypothetical protein SI65_09059 [Aspergillus cristatus]
MPSSTEPVPAVSPYQATQTPVSPLSDKRRSRYTNDKQHPKPALLSSSVAKTKRPHDALSSVSPVANTKPLDTHACSTPLITDKKPLDTEVPCKTTAKSRHICINGSIHKGGGQVIRNAVTLAALTSQPLTIHSIRTKRPGQKGLRDAHVAAIESLAEVSNSIIESAKIGSTRVSFYPPARIDGAAVKKVYSGHTTPGSVFMTFQTLYPYLLHAAALSGNKEPICVDIQGGTNIHYSPTFDSASQVLVPTLKTLGFPRLDIELYERGWNTGPVKSGSVRIIIYPLPSSTGPDGGIKCHFPTIDLDQHRRGEVTKIDVTILAPDSKVSWETRGTTKKEDKLTVRKFLEQEVIAELRDRLQGSSIPSHVIDKDVPIDIHTSEPTQHHTHIYVLIVGHTTTGFRVTQDELFEAGLHYLVSPCNDKHKRLLVLYMGEECVRHFAREVYDRNLEEFSRREGKHKPCVSRAMRDQLVIFEELGRFYFPQGDRNEEGPQRNHEDGEDGLESKEELENDGGQKGDHGNKPDGQEGREESKSQEEEKSVEDDRYWSGHTKSARRVCREILFPSTSHVDV